LVTGVDFASLDVLLQRVRRRPQDRPLRLRAAQEIALLAEFGPFEADKLLSEAVLGARLLRRSLERANKNEPANADDLSAMVTWIEGLHNLLLKIIQRPQGQTTE
jgi:hypothetical protein